MSPAGQSDDKAMFLAEFRALRSRAALDYGELSARTHFPSDVLIEAESGPDLPSLPILVAYVRACDADVSEWEERWRRLNDIDGPVAVLDDENDRGLPVRPAGASPAAKAGARAGVAIGPAEGHDPERIKAALRAHRAREESSRSAASASAAASSAASASAAGHGSAAAFWSGSDSEYGQGADAPNGGSATKLANGHHYQQSPTAAHSSAPRTEAGSLPRSPAESAPGSAGASGLESAVVAPGNVTSMATSAIRAAAARGVSRVKLLAFVVVLVLIGCVLLIIFA
jgi:hypothetical protein